MFDLEKAIAAWRAETIRTGIGRPEVLDELEAHLRELTDGLKAELGEAGAFESAVAQLGDSEVLKREFTKVNRFRFWPPRDNPILLNLLAAWFVLQGMQSLHVFLRRTVFAIIPAGLFSLSIHALFALQIVVGIGLLRRRNFWRQVAFGYLFLAAYFLISVIYMSLTTPRPPQWNIAYADVFMGIMIPARYTAFLSWIDLSVSIWGAFYLAKASTQNLFRSPANTTIA